MMERRITRGRKRGNASPLSWRYFMFGELDKSTLTEKELWDMSILQSDVRDAETGMTATELWAKQQAAIIRTWLRKHPGRRPWAWWRFDSKAPRHRLGGTGTLWHECLGACKKTQFMNAGCLRCGLQSLWNSITTGKL